MLRVAASVSGTSTPRALVFISACCALCTLSEINSTVLRIALHDSSSDRWVELDPVIEALGEWRVHRGFAHMRPQDLDTGLVIPPGFESDLVVRTGLFNRAWLAHIVGRISEFPGGHRDGDSRYR